MLFKIKMPLYSIPKLAPHFNLFHKAYRNNMGEIKSSIKTTIVALLPVKSNPKNAICLSGIVTVTATDIAAHNSKIIDRTFRDNGIGFHPFI